MCFEQFQHSRPIYGSWHIERKAETSAKRKGRGKKASATTSAVETQTAAAGEEMEAGAPERLDTPPRAPLDTPPISDDDEPVVFHRRPVSPEPELELAPAASAGCQGRQGCKRRGKKCPNCNFRLCKHCQEAGQFGSFCPHTKRCSNCQ